MLTPTGSWIGKFPDYGVVTWVALTWDDLQEVDIDGSLPDKTQVTGFLWTVHSAGERWMDGIYGLPKGGDPDVFAKFTTRHPAAVDLHAEFFRNQFTEDLFAVYTLRQNNVHPPVFSGAEAIATTAPYNYGSSSYHVYGLQNPNSKKAFTALGRHWLFYCQGEIGNIDDRELCFISKKGATWSSKTVIPGITNVYGSFTDWGA